MYMVSSVPNPGIGALSLFTLLPLLAMAQVEEEPMPISLDAESSSFDRQANTVLFTGLRITQGDFTIQADSAEATGLDFEQSAWSFNGNVRVAIESANIESAHAEVTFEAHELATIELRGDPAVFEDFTATREHPIRGGAMLLQFDHIERTLRMIDGAWLSEGPNEFRGCDLIYNLDEEKITSGSSDCGEPVVITIVPPSDDTDQDQPDAP